jgi:hypothetical protein
VCVYSSDPGFVVWYSAEWPAAHPQATTTPCECPDARTKATFPQRCAPFAACLPCISASYFRVAMALLMCVACDCLPRGFRQANAAAHQAVHHSECPICFEPMHGEPSGVLAQAQILRSQYTMISYSDLPGFQF